LKKYSATARMTRTGRSMLKIGTTALFHADVFVVNIWFRAGGRSIAAMKAPTAMYTIALRLLLVAWDLIAGFGTVTVSICCMVNSS
jgi:hypothetical protein